MKIQVSINPKIIGKPPKPMPKNIQGFMATMHGYYSMEVKDFINKVIKKGYAWSAPKFKNNYRNKKSFISSNIIGIDIDHGLTIQEVLKDKFVQDNALLLYTSSSHSSKEHRFRIIFKLDETYTSGKQIEQVIKVLINHFNADPACKDCCRIFYGNKNAKVKVFGKILNLKESEDERNNVNNMAINDNSSVCEISNDNITKNIDYLLRNKTDLNEMLEHIQKKHKKLSYNEWLSLCSSIWSTFSFDESIEVLQKHYPEEQADEYSYKYDHRLKTIPYTHIIKLAVKCGYSVPEDTYSDFARMSTKGKWIITPVSLNDFLTSKGFFTFFYNDNETDFQLIKEESNILKEVGIKKICEYVQESAEKNYGKNDSVDIKNFLISSNIVCNKTLNFLKSPEFEIHRDTIDTSYFYFKNGFLEIKKDNLSFHNSYNELDNKKLWGTSIKNRPFEIDKTPCEFETFLYRVSNKDQERLDILKGVMGYLLHRYKNPNVNKCVVLNDEVINIDNPSGRTGKSLIALALSHVRNTVDVDGKNYKADDRFRFQNLSVGTEIVNMDDVTSNFNLKQFYSILSGNLKIENKGEKALIVPFDKSPKFLFSSNYTVDTGGGSDRARVVEISLHNHYNEYRQPQHEFGHSFFIDWDLIEWNRFYTFCAQCVQQYFEMGMLNTINSSLLRNKIVKQTSAKFADWIWDYDFYVEGQSFYDKKVLFSSYNALQQEQNDGEFITGTMHTQFTKKFFNIMEIGYKEKCKRINDKTEHGYELIS